MRTRTADPSRTWRALVDFGFWIYKSLFSPLLHVIAPSRCIYFPTCSEYAQVAIARFGAIRGGWLAARRIACCHPFAKGGVDLVPQRDFLAGAATRAADGSSRSSAEHLP